MLINLLLVSLIVCSGAVSSGLCNSACRVGVLPFHIYSGEKVDYLRESISNQLSQELLKNDQIIVIDQEKLPNLTSQKLSDGEITPEELHSIAQAAGTHFLVYGSLTKIEDKLSLDSRVFTLLEDTQSYKTFGEGEDLSLLVKQAADRITQHVQSLASRIPPAETLEAKSTAMSDERKEASPPAETPGTSPAAGLPPEAPGELPVSPPEEPIGEAVAAIHPSPPAPESAAPEPEGNLKGAGTPSGPKKTASEDFLSSHPINITSDRMEADNRNRTVNFLGNVVAKREDMVIFANRITTFYAETGKINKIVATGNVKINQNDRIATCQEATFWQLPQKIILTGKPKVWQGNNIVSGEEIVFFLSEDKIDVKGGKQSRVNAIIYPTGKDAQRATQNP